MLTFKIWHIGHYSSEEWFGHHGTKPSVGRCDGQYTYRDDNEKEENKKKDKKKDEKKKSVAFKATSSSKCKAKQELSSEDEDSSFDDMDDEKTALFV